MYILGAGYAYPETVISNPFLAELSGELPASLITELTGVLTRYSVLDPSYLRETKNRSIREASKGSLCSPTDLAVRAAEMAIKRAGISPEDIGLIVGDCATPREMIPSEAQRVAKRFTLRVPAYDLVSSSASISLAFSNLLSWKDDRVPPYVLFVTTNTPTDRADFFQGTPRLRFGDGAAAFILSNEKTGKLKVEDAFFDTDPSRGDAFVFDIFSHATMADDAGDLVEKVQARLLAQVCAKHGLKNKEVKWIGSPFDLLTVKRISEEAKISPENMWSNVERCGDMLGSSGGCVLAERWDNLVPGETIVMTQAGVGFSSGFALLRGAN